MPQNFSRLSCGGFLALLTVLFIVTPGCRKNRDDGGGGGGTSLPTAADLTKMLNVQEGAVLKWEESWLMHHDTVRASFDMGQWLLQQSEVERVYLTDDWHTVIRYKSGLRSGIGFSALNGAGRALYRDGTPKHSRGSVTKHILGGHNKTAADGDKTIGNNKVLLFVPVATEFYGTYPFLPKFDQSDTKLEVTLVTEDAATFSVFKTVHEYGLVIINTHGSGDGAFYLYTGVDALDIPARPKAGRWTEAEVADYIAQSGGNEMLDLLTSGKLYWESGVLIDLLDNIKPTTTSIRLSITDEYIRAMPNKLKDAVVFGNHCYSGGAVAGRFQDDPGTFGNLQSAWMEAGAVAYYGYAYSDGASDPVKNEFCVQMEDSIITNLVVRGDSTGVAHLAGDAAEQFYDLNRSKRSLVLPAMTYKDWNTHLASLPSRSPDKMYLKLFHSPEYSYGCGTLTDPRDGEKYKLACIGDQTWMAENLRYNAPGSRVVDNNPANAQAYGRLYTWDAVSAGAAQVSLTSPGFRGVCPQGWHVPSRVDYDKLRAGLAQKFGAAQSGVQIKSKSALWTGDPTMGAALRNASGFAAMPAGAYNATGSEGIGEVAFFWLSSKFQTGSIPAHRGFFFVENTSSDIEGYNSAVDPVDAAACRCVQDD